MTYRHTPQMDSWRGPFGCEYTERNAYSLEEFEAFFKQNFGVTRTELNQRFLEGIPRTARILEVGANIGNQLACLQKMGFINLFGIELQHQAARMLKQRTHQVRVVQASATGLPFSDASFDLIFTSGVLIHISPRQINAVLREIYRCVKTYIWGFEYWSKTLTEIPYRGHQELLWKADYPRLYAGLFPDLTVMKEEKLKYLDAPNRDVMFLIKKPERAEQKTC